MGSHLLAPMRGDSSALRGRNPENWELGPNSRPSSPEKGQVHCCILSSFCLKGRICSIVANLFAGNPCRAGGSCFYSTDLICGNSNLLFFYWDSFHALFKTSTSSLLTPFCLYERSPHSHSRTWRPHSNSFLSNMWSLPTIWTHTTGSPRVQSLHGVLSSWI